MRGSEKAPPERAARVLGAARLSFGGNVFLALVKLIAGTAAQSAALRSDAAHSASDALCSLAVLLGLRLSGKKGSSDAAERAAAVLLAVIMALTGAFLACGAVSTLTAPPAASVPPGRAAGAAAIFSVAVKEALFRTLRRRGEETGSPALTAEAWHHRSDSLSSLGAFAGVLGARRGLVWCEPAAEGGIALLILGAAGSILRETLAKRGGKKTEQRE